MEIGIKTHRLARSSFIPGLRLPDEKTATIDAAIVTIATAVSAGCEKNALKPPRIRIAIPRYTSVPAKTKIARRMIEFRKLACNPGVRQRSFTGVVRALDVLGIGIANQTKQER